MTVRRGAAALTVALVALIAPLVLVALVTPVSGAAEPDDACPPGGARVVVDFGDLKDADGDADAAIRASCDDEVADERAGKTVADAGFALTYATKDPGFVCRVDGVPAEDPCVKAAPADAYWSVWWAAPGGDWVYSSRGVGTLRTPEGGHVALVWHSGDGKVREPSLSPSATGEVTLGPQDVSAAGSDQTEGLPTWIPALVVVAVLGAAGTVVVRRRAV